MRNFAGHYVLPGGHVDAGESLTLAAAREVTIPPFLRVDDAMALILYLSLTTVERGNRCASSREIASSTLCMGEHVSQKKMLSCMSTGFRLAFDSHPLH